MQTKLQISTSLSFFSITDYHARASSVSGTDLSCVMVTLVGLAEVRFPFGWNSNEPRNFRQASRTFRSCLQSGKNRKTDWPSRQVNSIFHICSNFRLAATKRKKNRFWGHCGKHMGFSPLVELFFFASEVWTQQKDLLSLFILLYYYVEGCVCTWIEKHVKNFENWNDTPTSTSP